MRGLIGAITWPQGKQDTEVSQLIIMMHANLWVIKQYLSSQIHKRSIVFYKYFAINTIELQ